ncbi:hypothetical protein H5410_053070 [Solanum commersonii]|uniref:S-protein homolog n=1 Tax=Solanum commersonii TaxID=4109 RepID=A0A9J5X2U1_SOLCO|nr:hypothetical protein H5410_053070 [Solanum commersonii]
MSYFKNNNCLFFSFIFTLSLALVRSSKLNPNIPSYQVNIVNALPNGTSPLTLRCQDYENHELGTHSMNVAEEYMFTSIGVTSYYCFYYWNGESNFFDVINEEISRGCGYVGPFLYGCYWKVQEDGFYFGRRQDGRFYKEHSW